MNGIINVYKPKGMTSHDVVSIIRKFSGIRKVGHTGTLDPDAEGVLPICIGKATKVADMLTAQDKAYRAELILGITTDTQDGTGNIISRKPVVASQTEIEKAIKSFIGNLKQVPPMYSAVKVNGKKLYELARKGIEVKREPRDIEIYNIDIKTIDISNNTAVIDVYCSKGTYIRTLCADIGEKIGCGAHMSALLRTKSGPFTIDKSFSLDKIERLAKENGLRDILVPIDSLFMEYDAVTVGGELEKKVRNGNELDISLLGMAVQDKEFYRVYSKQGELLSISRIVIKPDGRSYLKIVKGFYEV